MPEFLKSVPAMLAFVLAMACRASLILLAGGGEGENRRSTAERRTPKTGSAQSCSEIKTRPEIERVRDKSASAAVTVADKSRRFEFPVFCSLKISKECIQRMVV